MTISVIIHTHNEEKNISACIDSAKLLTDQVSVIDMNSQDKTVEIAKTKKAKIYHFPFSYYVEPARNFAMEKADSNWVLILDADERITKELVEEIKHKLTESEQTKLAYSSFQIPRKNIFVNFGWLKHGGWWPDYQTRLINKKYFKNWPKEIHSTPVIEGTAGKLTNYMSHYFHGDLESMVNKTIIFEDIESELLFKAGRHASTIIFFRKFIGELYRRLIKHKGFLDGTIGIIESIYQAFSKTITYLYLYEKNRSL